MRVTLDRDAALKAEGGKRKADAWVWSGLRWRSQWRPAGCNVHRPIGAVSNGVSPLSGLID